MRELVGPVKAGILSNKLRVDMALETMYEGTRTHKHGETVLLARYHLFRQANDIAVLPMVEEPHKCTKLEAKRVFITKISEDIKPDTGADPGGVLGVRTPLFWGTPKREKSLRFST